MIPRLSPSSPSLPTLFAWVGGLSVSLFAAGLHLGSPHGLWAYEEAGRAADTDADGLPDTLEEVLRLDQDRTDSDGDGWSDAEELARQSDPKDAQSGPATRALGVNVKGYNDEGELHVVVAIYQRGGIGSDHRFELAAVAGGRTYVLPPRAYLPYTDVRVVAGKDGADTVHLLDLELPRGLVERLGSASFVVVGSESGSRGIDEAAALNVQMVGGMPFEVSMPAGPGTGGARVNGGSGTGPQLPGNGGSPPPVGGGPATERASIYNALTPPSQDSAQASGKICVQTTRMVGAGGAALFLEVVSGSCEEGDGTCPASCGTTGGVYQVVDPLTLIGG